MAQNIQMLWISQKLQRQGGCVSLSVARNQRTMIRGGTYHVMNRGNRKVAIFEDDRDRRRFVRLLAETSEAYHVEILIGVLMVTHFHLVVVTPEGNLSEFMQQLEGQFAQYSNWRHRRVGHVFQGRFKAVVIESDIHLFTAFWYVALNPVVSKLVSRPEDWRWSTYGPTVGLSPVPSYLSVDWVNALFPSDSLNKSQRLCRQCMQDEEPVVAYIHACEPTTAVAIHSYVAERLRTVDQPCAMELILRPPIAQLFPRDMPRLDFKTTIVTAHEQHRYTLAEIARHVGVHPATISKIYSQIRKRALDRGQTP